MKKSDKHVVTQIQSEESVKEFLKEYPKPVYGDLFEDKLKPSLEELEKLIKGNPDKSIGALFLCGEKREMDDKRITSSRIILGNASTIYNCLLSTCINIPEFEKILRTVVKELDFRNEIVKEFFNKN